MIGFKKSLDTVDVLLYDGGMIGYVKSIFPVVKWKECVRQTEEFVPWDLVHKTFEEIEVNHALSMICSTSEMMRKLRRPRTEEEEQHPFYSSCLKHHGWSYNRVFFLHDGKIVTLVQKNEKIKAYLLSPYNEKCAHKFRSVSPTDRDLIYEQGIPRPTPERGYRVFFCDLCGMWYDVDSSD
ncbi:MAG: hypothetical protein N3A54_01310 [Patescibacteria group bacterium]|nr:hypothetical protein [Patescibacteria group bacterium]